MLWLAAALAADPVPRDRPGLGMPERLWDVTHLDLDVTLDLEGRALSGRTQHSIVQLGRPRDRIRLHQRDLTITQARVDGTPAPFEVGPTWVEVRLPPGAEHVVQLDYQATPAAGLYVRGTKWGDPVAEVWTQGEEEDNRWWFPSWDVPNDKFTVTTHIDAPSELTVRGLGPQTAAEPRPDGRTRSSFKMDRPVANYLVTLVAGDYQVLTLNGPVPIEILAARTVDPAVLARTVADVPAQIAYYERRLDEPFPYPMLRMVFVSRFLYGGMENPTLTVLPDTLLAHHDDSYDLRRASDTLAHEVVHHWFGDLLTCYGWNEWWLNEGFARYYEKQWTLERYGEDAFAVNLRATVEHARQLPRPLAPNAHTRTHPVSAWTGSYNKGAAVLSGLRQQLSPPVYEQAIQSYIDTHHDGLVDSHDLRRSLEATSGQSLAWFFDQWVTGAGIPTWNATSEVQDGELTLTVVPDDSAFYAQMLVEIGTSTGPIHKTLELGSHTTQLQLSLPEPPLYIALDPDDALLGTLHLDQSEAAWLAQLRSAHPGARLDALAALAALPPTDPVLDALVEWTLRKQDVELRLEAGAALAEHAAQPEAKAAFVQLLDSDEALLRRLGVASLTPEDDHIDRVAALVRDDPHEQVVARGLTWLAEHDPQRGLALSRRALRRSDPTPTGSRHRSALSALRKGTADDADRVAPFLTDPRPRVRRRAMTTLSALLPTIDHAPTHDKLQRTLAAAVKRQLDDPGLGARSTALEVAAHLHRRDVPMLERFVAHNPLPRLDRSARAAIDAILHPPADTSLTDRLEALSKRLNSMEGQLGDTHDRLEALESRP